MPCQVVISVTDLSQVGEARRALARLSSGTQLNESSQGRLAIIVTELGTNLVKHARNGLLMFQVLTLPAGSAVEIISLDSGPGITDTERALSDGYSTAGSAGNGLGAAKRLSDEFDIYSQPSTGTAIVCRVFDSNPGSVQRETAVWGAISIAAPHETQCGDSWYLAETEGHLSVMVADGLGHGPLASDAAEAAVSTLASSPLDSPEVFLAKAHRSLCGSRGAAVAMARTSREKGLLVFSGIGNISASVIGAGLRRGLCSHNGTVGVQVRKFQRFEYDYNDRELLILHSDGMQNRWNVSDYPGLIQRHPSVIAATLCRDFKRGRDDVTVVIVRLSTSKA